MEREGEKNAVRILFFKSLEMYQGFSILSNIFTFLLQRLT